MSTIIVFINEFFSNINLDISKLKIKYSDLILDIKNLLSNLRNDNKTKMGLQEYDLSSKYKTYEAKGGKSLVSPVSKMEGTSSSQPQVGSSSQEHGLSSSANPATGLGVYPANGSGNNPGGPGNNPGRRGNPMSIAAVLNQSGNSSPAQPQAGSSSLQPQAGSSAQSQAGSSFSQNPPSTNPPYDPATSFPRSHSDMAT